MSEGEDFEDSIESYDSFGLNFDAVYHESLTSVILAAREGDEKELQRLIVNKKPCGNQDNRGWNALHYAAYNGHANCIKLLIDEGSCDVDNKTFRGSTPLLLGCKKLPSTRDAVFILLDNDANVQEPNDNSMTPLHYACRARSLEVVRWLIRKGADPNAPGFRDVRPMTFVVLNEVATPDTEDDMERVCRYLLKHGADPNLTDMNHKNLLDYFIKNESYAVAKLLLEVSSDQKGLCRRGKHKTRSVLSQFCCGSKCDYELFRLLMDSGGSDPSDVERDKDKYSFNSGELRTPLLYLCQNSRMFHDFREDYMTILKELIAVTSDAMYQVSNEELHSHRVCYANPLLYSLKGSTPTCILVVLQELLNSKKMFWLPPPNDFYKNEEPPYIPRRCGLFSRTHKSALSIVLMRFQGEGLEAILELMVAKGWDINSPDASKCLSPLNSFICCSYNTWEQQEHLTLAINVLTRMMALGAKYSPETDTLLWLTNGDLMLLLAGVKANIFPPDVIAVMFSNRSFDILKNREGFKRLIALFLVVKMANLVDYAGLAVVQQFVSNVVKKKNEGDWDQMELEFNINNIQPFSLKQLARMKVRRTLLQHPNPSLKFVETLNLPEIIKHYILFKKEREEIDFYRIFEIVDSLNL